MCVLNDLFYAGSNGFLGSHVLKFLINDESVSEIRAIDKVERNTFFNYFDSDDNKKIKFFNYDLLNLNLCRQVFNDVDTVIHCAGFVSYDYPPDVDQLHKNNVLGNKFFNFYLLFAYTYRNLKKCISGMVILKVLSFIFNF